MELPSSASPRDGKSKTLQRFALDILATALFVPSWPARCSNALFVISLIHEPPRCPRRKLIMRARTLGIGDGHKAATAEMPSSRHQERACATLIVRSSNNHLLCSLAGRGGSSHPCMIPTVTSFGSALMNWRKVSPTSTEPRRGGGPR